MKTLRICTLVGCLLLVAGCSAFKKRERLNLAPFAEYTVSLAAEVEYGASHINTPNLRVYRNDPAVVAHRAYWDRIRQLLRGVVAYSIEISTLGKSSLPVEERTERYAVFLDRLFRPVLELGLPEVRLQPGDLDLALAEIREQERFLDALRVAQPFIDETARLADQLFDRTQDDLEATFAHVDERIAADFYGPVETWARLLEAQDRVFRSLSRVRQYELTRDPSHLESLYESEPDLRPLVHDPLDPTPAEVEALRERIVSRLRLGIDLKELLAPDMARYEASQAQLDEIYRAAQRQIKKARVAVIVWARAHRNLAEGVTDPARIDIFDLTKKAVDTAL